MKAHSAGLLMFRRTGGGIELLLAHPGGPFWRKKDEGAWTLPKGEVHEGEEPLAAAQREFVEETGFTPVPPFLPLGEVKLASGKRIEAWAFEGDCDPTSHSCNDFEMEWPPKSGRRQSFPEIDRVEWFGPDEARAKLNKSQAAWVDRLLGTCKAKRL